MAASRASHIWRAAGGLTCATVASCREPTASSAASGTTCTGATDSSTRSNVRIPRPEEYSNKFRQLVAGGTRNLAVISDFDRTITRCFVGEKRCSSCYNIADGALSPEIVRYKKQIFDYYFPIEKDPNRTMEEKKPYMLEWYQKSNDSLVDGGFRREWLERAVRTAQEAGTLALRPGFAELLNTLQAHNVPVLIFSAGIANVITEIFQQLLPSAPLAKTTQVVGNEMTFDSDGVLRGWGPLIHMYNKNQSVVPKSQQRRNVLLLGDGLGDVTMADGAATEPACILKVGFLNEHEDELLAQYEAQFDMVILGDQGMAEVQKIVDAVLLGAQENEKLSKCYVHFVNDC